MGFLHCSWAFFPKSGNPAFQPHNQAFQAPYERKNLTRMTYVQLPAGSQVVVSWVAQLKKVDSSRHNEILSLNPNDAAAIHGQESREQNWLYSLFLSINHTDTSQSRVFVYSYAEEGG